MSQCPEIACAEGTLECGSGSYRLCARDSTAAASLPHSMALRAFSLSLGARQRTGMSDCLENSQSEIPLPRLRDRNDSLGRVTTQTPLRRQGVIRSEALSMVLLGPQSNAI